MMRDTQLIDMFQRERGDTHLAVVEGVQAIKHAVRFGAKLEHVITCDISLLKTLLAELAPDISQKVLNQAIEVDEATFSRLSPQPPRTKVIALAQRKTYKHTELAPDKPIVFLEDPRDLENIGAVIRVVAAADVAGVVISGPVDIWHPAVIRGAAGLHYALPVLNSSLKAIRKDRPMVALDPTGTVIQRGSIPQNAVLIFGTERHGISQATLLGSDQVIRLPMKEGVSSLNLATSVAATLYQLG